MATSKMHFTGNISDFDLRLLRVFKAVVESNSFTAAGVELNVSRSAISICMIDLEQRLGFKLCERGRSGFALTDAGRQIYENLNQVLNSLDIFRDQVNAIHSSLKGEISIGITDNLITVPHMRIVHSLQQLKERAPDVKINIRTMPPNDIEKGVLNGLFHIGIAPKNKPLTSLRYFLMYSENLGLYCGKNHEIIKNKKIRLTQDSVLDYDAIAPAYAQPENIKSMYAGHKISATVSDRESTAFLLMTGKFVGYLPTHYAQKWEESGEFHRILADKIKYKIDYCAVVKADHQSDPILKQYLHFLNATQET